MDFWNSFLTPINFIKELDLDKRYLLVATGK